MDLKDLIRNRRIELGLTMKELAELIGVSEGTISRWESGEISNMKRDKIQLLAKALGVSPSVIMGWDPSDDSTDIPSWYSDPTTAAIAQQIFDDPELRLLFDAAKDAKPEDLQLVHNMLKALKRKENPEYDDPA